MYQSKIDKVDQNRLKQEGWKKNINKNRQQRRELEDERKMLESKEVGDPGKLTVFKRQL